MSFPGRMENGNPFGWKLVKRLVLAREPNFRTFQKERNVEKTEQSPLFKSSSYNFLSSTSSIPHAHRHREREREREKGLQSNLQDEITYRQTLITNFQIQENPFGNWSIKFGAKDE
ncbi:hypothetical protein RJ641_010997 [Dillenia turbinata]|uniref:Uncharacterized protein n=1 Tax=Dillenia turbinata TaxID=194707 RepID=A0AAN8V7J1_9MAGN